MLLPSSEILIVPKLLRNKKRSWLDPERSSQLEIEVDQLLFITFNVLSRAVKNMPVFIKLQPNILTVSFNGDSVGLTTGCVL